MKAKIGQILAQEDDTEIVVLVAYEDGACLVALLGDYGVDQTGRVWEIDPEEMEFILDANAGGES